MSDVPPLRARALPLVAIGSVLAALRLALDELAPDAPFTMYFGTFFLMPFAILWVGLTGRWGPVSWRQMAGTMVVVAVIVWGVWNTIAYTTGQFMEWTHGRFDPGVEVVQPDGTVAREGARAAPVQATAIAKLDVGALHGLLSTLASTVWCTAFGTLLIWLPVRLRARR